jgi:hypothetical protein
MKRLKAYDTHQSGPFFPHRREGGCPTTTWQISLTTS